MQGFVCLTNRVALYLEGESFGEHVSMRLVINGGCEEPEPREGHYIGPFTLFKYVASKVESRVAG